ncbi:MAG: hypothetical protein OJF49_002769 [Ktedonobacterales bacterium]|jgi:hypothetical protein|nr:MAG: hypothetical protein OJF49_002769 [Ktedonobacterales bacterium]
MSQLRVFISHAKENTAFAEWLASDLRRAGADVWLDASHLVGPGDFLDRINRALSNRDILVLVLSPAALASKWVPDEMHAAILRYKDGFMGAPLVVVAQSVPLQDIPPLWAVYNRIDIPRDYRGDYQASLPSVLKALSLKLSLPQPYKPATLTPATETPSIPAPSPSAAASASAPQRQAAPPASSPALPIAPPAPAPQRQATPAPRPNPTSAPSPAPQVAPSPWASAQPARRDLPLKRSASVPVPAGPVVSRRKLLITTGAVAASLTTAGGVALWIHSRSSGQQHWRVKTGGPVISSPVVANNVVYVGSEDGSLYAVDASAGKPRWRFPTGNKVVSSPVVANGVVYVGSGDDYLYAVDASAGTLRWRFPTGGEVDSSPTVADGVVYVGSRDYSLYAVDASAGTQRWNFQTVGPVLSKPVVANGVVYVGSDDGYLYAVNV